MIYRLRIRGLARRDILDERAWYEREAPHMVSELLEEFAARISSIEENPLMYPRVFGEVRRALLTRLSYAIFFTVEEETIFVFAVMHQSRDEGRWKRRITGRK